MVNYNDGSSVATLLAGTAINMDFGANGQVTGSSGCNSFNAGYSVNGDALSIGAPGGTQRLCPEPQGVMDQEARFLSALRSAASFGIVGSQLEVSNGGGQIAIVASQAP